MAWLQAILVRPCLGKDLSGEKTESVEGSSAPFWSGFFMQVQSSKPILFKYLFHNVVVVTVRWPIDGAWYINVPRN